MLIRKIKLDVGASSPFNAVHSSDGHLALADIRDGERKVKLGIDRAHAFTGSDVSPLIEMNREIFDYAKDKDEVLLYTGDFLDFVSKANIELAKEFFSSVDTFTCAGNHEYSLYVGEAWEDERYKAQSFDDVNGAFPNDIWYSERVINGVRFVALDNNYYYILPLQFERFKRACAGDEPVVLLVHNPLYSEDMYAQVTKGKSPDEPPYLCGCPDDKLTSLSEHRRRQQTTDDITAEFIEFCNNTPKLKAVLAGHLHVFYESKLDSGIPQIVCAGGFIRDIIEYTFI